MAMFSLLRNHGYTLASAFKLRPSVLPLSYVATRHFLTTSPPQSLPRKAGEEASSKPKPSAVKKSDDKPNVESDKKSASPAKQDIPPKPKRFTKKDLSPPSKGPLSAYAAFVLEYRAKQQQATGSPIAFQDAMRDASTAWAKFSEAEKKAYSPSREAIEAHRVVLEKWQAGLSVEAKKALKLRRRRKNGTGHALFITETFKEAVGDTFGEKISNRAAVWNSLPSQTQAEYAKRASETQFGVRVRRAAQHERKMENEAKKKVAIKDRKKKEKALKQMVLARKKLEQAKLKQAAAAEASKAKRKNVEAALKQKEKAKRELERMKQEAKSGKKKVKITA